MSHEIVAIIIFTITYIGIIFTRLPWMNIDRPSAAFFGAVAMITFNVISFEDAIKAIDFETIALLLGIMIMIASLQVDGFFTFFSNRLIFFANTPQKLLYLIVFVTGFGSAFFVNDAVVLIFTPIIINVCKKSNINPMPFLIAEILAANAGSAMTITGNPQNMIIGVNSGITYLNFFLKLLPISLISMFLIIVLLKMFYKKELHNSTLIISEPDNEITKNKKFVYSLTIFASVVIMFFFSKILNLSIPLIALIGASLILIFGKTKPSRVIKEVDWVLLLFFAGLFIVVKSVENTFLFTQLHNVDLHQNFFTTNVILHTISLVFTQIVSNVPFVIASVPIIKPYQNEFFWLILASASTIAGNATIIGAVANLIVIESASKLGIKISFKQFLKIGLPHTIVSLIFSVVWFEFLWYFAKIFNL